jgi:hypothetical protein
MRFLALSSAVLLLSLSSLHAAEPGTASGTMTVNGTKTPLKYSISRLKKNPFDEKKTDVVVLISDVPVSADDFKDDFAMMRFTDKAKLTGVMVEITDDKSIISGTLYSPLFTKMGGSFSATGMHELKTTVMNGTDVAGTLSITKPEEFAGSTYSYNTTFHAAPGALTPPPAASKTAKALPANGGPAGVAYLDYTKVLTRGDLKELKTRLTAERAKQLDDPEITKMLPLIQAMQPKDIKIVSGSIDGGVVTLITKGKEEGGGTSNGTITMVNESGKWKVQKESWESKN